VVPLVRPPVLHLPRTAATTPTTTPDIIMLVRRIILLKTPRIFPANLAPTENLLPKKSKVGLTKDFVLSVDNVDT